MNQRIPVTELTSDFKGRAREALADSQLRSNFRTAMDSSNSSGRGVVPARLALSLLRILVRALMTSPVGWMKFSGDPGQGHGENEQPAPARCDSQSTGPLFLAQAP